MIGRRGKLIADDPNLAHLLLLISVIALHAPIEVYNVLHVGRVGDSKNLAAVIMLVLYC